MTDEEVEALFGSTTPSAEGQARIESVRLLTKAYFKAVNSLVPPGRKAAQFKTCVEDACGHAIKGIALRCVEGT